MAPPTHHQVTVDCNALRSDAKKWSAAADDIGAAASTAGGLTLGVDKFGASDAAQGCQSTYAILQSTLATLLSQGNKELEKVATVLKASADTYEREDAAGAHRFEKMGR